MLSRNPGAIVPALVTRALTVPLPVNVAVLAILKAGGAYVPLNPDNPPARLQQQLEGAVALITESKLLANLPLELYLVADTVAGWPINVSLVVFTTWYPLRQLRRAGLMSGAPLPLSAMDAVELAVEESAPTTV